MSGDRWLRHEIVEAACAKNDTMKTLRRTIRALLAHGHSIDRIKRRVLPAANSDPMIQNQVELMIDHEADTTEAP